MEKVKVTADSVLSIITGLLGDADIDTVIADTSAPNNWRDKRISEALNVKYYTFKHRPESSEKIIAEKLKDGQAIVNRLEALNRSFCLVSLDSVERTFSKDVDLAVVSASMEYWIQTNKIKLLESLIESCNLKTCGIRIPVVFGGETRQAVIVLSNPNVTDVQPATVCGEMAVCAVAVSLIFYPDVVSCSDYSVSFAFTGDDGETITSKVIPLSSFSAATTMNQKAVPYATNAAKTGSINLSGATSFVLVFDGYNNAFINYISDKALQGVAVAQNGDNNQGFIMSLTRKNKTYTHDVVIKDHQIAVNDDTGNEVHSLSLAIRGIA